MPKQQIIPTWLAWNNANFPTESGLQDRRTKQDFPAGGLGLGDYFDATEDEANTASFPPNGLLHAGRYRLVQVDSGATAANVQTGTIGLLRTGSFVQGISIQTPGTGGVPGTYNVLAIPGSAGGVGAAIQVIVGAAGGIISATVLQGGLNYVWPGPSFDLTATGVTGATLQARMNISANLVTSANQGLQARPVVFLNSITPGNFGFVQELGVASFLCGTTPPFSQGDWINFIFPFPASPAIAGTVVGTALASPPTGVTVGRALEAMVSNQLVKGILMIGTPVVQD
jgi:hypothetical protein